MFFKNGLLQSFLCLGLIFLIAFPAYPEIKGREVIIELMDKTTFTGKLLTVALDEIRVYSDKSVEKIKTSQTTVYKPLISKWVWYGIFISMLGLITYLSFNDSAVSAGLLEKFNLGTLPKFSMPNLFSGLHFSKTTIYACVLLTLMLFIQIPIIKHVMNRRLEI